MKIKRFQNFNESHLLKNLFVNESLNFEELSQTDNIQYWRESILHDADVNFINMVTKEFEKYSFKFELKDKAGPSYTGQGGFDNNSFKVTCPNTAITFTMRFSKSGSTLYFGIVDQLIPENFDEKYKKLFEKGYRSIKGIIITVKKINPLALNSKLSGPSNFGII